MSLLNVMAEHISESVFVSPYLEMWQFLRMKDYGYSFYSCLGYAVCPLLGQNSISSRVWSYISSLSHPRFATTSK